MRPTGMVSLFDAGRGWPSSAVSTTKQIRAERLWLLIRVLSPPTQAHMPDSLPIDLRSMSLVIWLFILDPVDLVANLDCDGPCWMRAVDDDAVVFPSVPRLLEMR